MQKISMLGSGFIARFYTDSLHGYRSKDKVVSIYSRWYNHFYSHSDNFFAILSN